MFLTSPELAGIKHGFFTRKGGVSEGILTSLNCGWGTSDSLEHVIENRSRVAAILGTRQEQLCSVNQVHGNQVITVETPWTRDMRPKADAMVTRRKNIALGVLAADCVPVLFADSKAGVIGAAHAGWKGALAGVIRKTIEAMRTLGATPSGIIAAIGPCIGKASYEVGSEFYAAVTHENVGNSRFFLPARDNGHWMFDLRSYVRGKIQSTGVTAINTLENDTYLEEDSFFSFRRTTHRKEGDYGRQISAIIL